MHPDYLEKVLNAQVYDVASETPLDLAGNLSARVGNKISLKREDMQPVFSFKLRGAYNKMVRLTEAQRQRGRHPRHLRDAGHQGRCRPRSRWRSRALRRFLR